MFNANALSFLYLNILRSLLNMEQPPSYHLWDNALQHIQEPPPEKKIWKVPYEGQPLSLVIVEPRCHRWLLGVLRNMAHVYGGTNTSLYIFHGTENVDFVKALTQDWHGVQYKNIGKANLALCDYNRMMTSHSFWDQFLSNHVLIFQTDTCIRRQIDPDYFKYDYVGAPWPFRLPMGVKVGNGGFSLRRVTAMKQLTFLHNETEKENEDLYIACRLAKNSVPGVDIAARFSVEHIYHPDPCGLHQAWRFHPLERVKEWLQTLPGYVV
jgi:hypothetical protein